MGPFDAFLSTLGNLGNSIGGYVRPSLEQLGLLKPPAVVSPIPQGYVPPTPTPTPNYSDIISRGMQNFSPGNVVPAASMSSQLATAGQGLPDPRIAAVLSLMESGGGQRMRNNNLFNLGPGIPYPDLQTAILGGGENNQFGFKGIMREGGPYQDYRQSGNLEDFFSIFTPPGPGNPTIEELLNSYYELRKLFE